MLPTNSTYTSLKETTPFWLKLFFALVFLLPFTFALNPSDQIDLSFVRLFIIFIFFLWLAKLLIRKQLIIDFRFRFWALLIFLSLCALSLLWAGNLFRAERKLLFLFSLFPFYFLAFTATLNASFRLSLIRFLILGATASAFFSLLIFSAQFIIGLNPTLKIITQIIAPFFLGTTFSHTVITFPSWLVNLSGKTVLRTLGTFPDPHLLALYLNMLLPLTWFLLVRKKLFSSKLKSWIIFLIILTASLLSFSRAGYLSLLVGMAFLFLSNNLIVLFRKKSIAILIFLSFFVLFFAIPNPITNRFLSSFDFAEGSNQGRIIMWQKALKIIRLHPFGGVGLGNLSYELAPKASYRTPIYAHNLFLDFGAETGLFNALLLSLIILSPLFSYFKKPTPLKKALASALLIFFVHSLFETPFYSVRVFPLFLILLAFNE